MFKQCNAELKHYQKYQHSYLNYWLALIISIHFFLLALLNWLKIPIRLKTKSKKILWRWFKKITCLWYPFKILLILNFWHDTIWKYLMQICMRFWWFFLVICQRINKLLTVLWLWHLCRKRLRWARQRRIR